MAKPWMRVGPRKRRAKLYGTLLVIMVSLLIFGALVSKSLLPGVPAKLSPFRTRYVNRYVTRYVDNHIVIYKPYDRASIPKGTQMPIPPFKKRGDLGDILNAEGMRTGVELGVQRGKFSYSMLSRWK